MLEKIELNSSGIRELLKSGEMSEAVSAVSSKIQVKCGSGYETDVYQTPSRVVSSVFTAEEKAVRDNLKNNTLLKAVSK